MLWGQPHSRYENCQACLPHPTLTRPTRAKLAGAIYANIPPAVRAELATRSLFLCGSVSARHVRRRALAAGVLSAPGG